MRTMFLAAIVGLVGISSTASAQDKASIVKKLQSEYSLTKTTDDQTDIVTAGSVLVLQKDKLMMVATTTTGNPCPNTYKDGKINQSGACRANEKMKKIPLFGHTIPGADHAPTTRVYVTGEKFWVTKIDVKDSGKEPAVVMDFYTDAVNEVRYKTSLTIPFKGSLPSADDALKLVQEVVAVAPSEDEKKDDKKQEAKGNAAPPRGGKPAPAAPAEQEAAAPAPAADAPPPPIEAPPPPPDAPAAPPPTVSLDQTPDQVTAILGQPQRKAKVGTKEIYFYKDLKVTFVNGKVKDIQ